MTKINAIFATECQQHLSVHRDIMCDDNGVNSLMDIQTLKRLMREHKESQADIARLLGISPDKVSKTLTGKRQLKLDEANKLATYFSSGNSNLNQVTRLLPIIGLVSAGAWQEAVEHARGYMPSPDKSLSNQAFVVEVEGDSMDLVAKDGDAVIVDPRELDLLPGRYYIVRNQAGETTFKRYMDNPARLEPCSSNPEHQPIFPGRDGFAVVGRVRKRVADL